MSVVFPFEAAIAESSLNQLKQLYSNNDPDNSTISTIFYIWYDNYSLQVSQSGIVTCVMLADHVHSNGYLYSKTTEIEFDIGTLSYVNIYFESSFEPTPANEYPWVPDSGIPTEILANFTKYYSFNSPIIIITGSNPVNVEVGQTYTDETSDRFAYFQYDGQPQWVEIETTSNVNTSIVGTYTVTYTATFDDTYATPTPGAPPIEPATETRTINVVDTTGPVITINGDNPVTIGEGQTYTDQGAAAYDAVDGNVTASIQTTSNVNTSSVGTYTVTYSVTDGAGNTSPKTRTVNVLDTTGPVITITGDNPVTIGEGQTYTDQGAAAYDSLDGNVTASIQTTSNVNTSSVGTYTVIYSVTDSAGNTSTKTRTVNVETINTIVFNPSIAYIRRDDLATLINSFTEVSSLKEIYNMWYNNTQITGGTDCWIYYAYSTVNNEVLYSSRKIKFLSKNDGTYEWIDNETIVNATVTNNGLSAEDLTDYTSFYSGLEPFKMNLSSSSINIVNALLNNSGYSLYNYIQIFNIWYNETNSFDMNYDNTTREIDVWVYVLTDQTAMEDILDKHATPIEPITDFDEKQITIEMLKPYLLEGGNVQPIFETRKLKYTVKNNNASYTWTLYTNETIESTINDTGYSVISSIDNYKLSYFYFDTYTIVRESSKEALRSLYLAYYNSIQKLKKINEVWYNTLDINSGEANDSEGPLITVLGQNPINIIQSTVSSYREIGVVAIDNADSDVTDQITSTYTNKATNITESTIDTSIVGEYIVTYTVQDNAGNVSTATRDVNIVADTVGPVLTILGDNPTQIELGTINTYVDGGASAIDSIDGNITDQIIITNLNTVDLTTYGTYTITYTIEDSTGNIVTKDRIVSVVEKIDSVAPVISLNGNRINYIIVNSVASYTDEGATATDDTDGTVTVTTSGTVTTTEVGTYVVTYTATDSVGNSTTENRTIYVIEEPVAADSEPPPTITLNGDSILDIYRHEASPLPDEGATAVDSYGNSLTVETTVHPNTYALGTSIIAYTARDSNDNIGFASRKINVLPQYIPSTFELVELTDSLFFQMIKADNYYRLVFNTTIDYQPIFNNYYPYPYNQIASQQIEFICMSNNSVKFKYRSTMINSGTIVYTNFENGSGQLGFTLTGVPQITNYGGTGYDLQNWANNQGTSYESVGFNSSNSRWFLNMHILSSNVPVETFGIGWMKMPTTNNIAHVLFKTEHGFPENGISNGTIRFNIYLMNFMYFMFLKRNSAGNNYILFNIYLNTNNHPHAGNDSNVEWNDDTNSYAYLYNVPFGLNEVEIEWNSTTQNYFINRQTNPTPVLTTSFPIGSESPTSLGLWYVAWANLRPFEPTSFKTNQQDMYYGNFYIKDNDTGNDHQIDFNDYHNVTEQQFFESKGIEPVAVGARMENVVIITTTRPVITLNGDPIINLYVGDTYTEQGASATLNNSPINTGGVTISGTVNTSTAGVYQIVYTARKYNSSLQEYYEDKAVRIVNVKIVDTESPIINIAGSNPTELILGSTYVDEGATATDNIDGTVSVVTSGDTITETSEEGEYRITYTATDNAGNVNTATRIVIIVSTRYLYSCFSMSTNASVVNNNGNKYVFNGDTSYTADKKYGLAVGTYTIKNIPAEHPMALLNQGKLHLITYTGDDAKKSSKSVTSTTADGTYDFYHGDITVTVLGNFLTLSIYCYYHGYMGGEKLLVYKEACEIGLPESLNIKYTLGLYKSSNASVVNNNGNKYLFNGHTTYSSKYQYGLGTGTYTITNIPEQHPMAILNAGKTLQISYSGDSTKKSSKEVTSTTADGTYDFYYGDITLTVNSNFDKVSVYCYNHGYMGGENLLVYSSDCKIQMPLIDSSSLSVVETTITASDIGMKIYGTGKDLDEYGLSILDSEINNKLDVKYNKNTRKWNTLMNIDMLSNVGSGLEDGLSSNNYFQIYHNIDYNIVQKIPELISKYNETYGEEIGIDKFYESDEIDNAHILDCYMKFYLLSNPISELYTSLEYNRVINGWKVKNPTEVYNRVKASNTVKYSVFRLTHLNSKGDDLKEKYNIVYPLHSIIKIYKLWYNSSSAGDEIVDGIMFYSYKEKDDVFVKTQFATVNILYTVIRDTFSVMSETPTIRSYDYNGEDL